MSAHLAVALAAHIASVVLANILTAHFGLVPMGFGLVATAGTYAAGLALLARDFVHRYGGSRWAFVGIGVGAALSWVLATPSLAVASFVAFTVAELADLYVYARLRRRGFARAAIASNAVGAPVDTLLFLAIAGFAITGPVVAGQLVGKFIWATLIPVAIYVWGRRALLRQPIIAEGA